MMSDGDSNDSDQMWSMRETHKIFIYGKYGKKLLILAFLVLFHKTIFHEKTFRWGLKKKN